MLTQKWYVSVYFFSINPITGRFETAKKDPMEGMTDEQKEYEAMQLVNKIDQLTRFVEKNFCDVKRQK